MAGGSSAILTLKILADAKDAIKGMDETSSAAGKLQSGVKSAAVPAAAALGALAAAGLSAASAAAEDQAAADQLALAMRNSAGASDASIAATEDWISKTSKAAAVADDSLRPALATLVRATGDVSESQDAMGVALDVSAATGKDVESVSTALAKAYGGQTAGLKKLVPGMDDAILASGDMDAIMAELARTTGGAAAEAANSAAGQMEGMKIQMGEAQESIGAALLPAMSTLATMLATVATSVQENSQLFLTIGGIIAGFAAAILIANAAIKAYTIITKVVEGATKAWAIAQRILNSAFLTNPLFLIIAGIVLLVTAIVLIATKTTWFQDIWETVWGAIKTVAEAFWTWLTAAATAAMAWVAGVWQSLQDAVQAVWNWITNAIGIALGVVRTIVMAYINIYVAIWNGLVAGVEAVWNWIKAAINTALSIIVGFVRAYINTIISIWEGIKTAVGAVWDWLKDQINRVMGGAVNIVEDVAGAFDRVVDAIKSVIDWLGRIKIPDVVKNIGGIIGGIIPGSASVGTVSAVGRAATFAAPALTAGATSSRATTAPTIVVQGALDPVAVARQIRLILRSDERRRSGVVMA